MWHLTTEANKLFVFVIGDIIYLVNVRQLAQSIDADLKLALQKVRYFHCDIEH